MTKDLEISEILLDALNHDEEAVEKLCQHYLPQLVRLAANRLRLIPRRVADEEDVALSAFDSFVRAAQAGRFPKLADRDDLWKLLVTITIRKCHKLKINHFAPTKGGGKVHGDSAFASANSSRGPGLDGIADREPTPDEIAAFTENVQKFFALLDAPRYRRSRLREIAQWRLDGYTNCEIAERLDRHVGAIERKFQLIRSIAKEWLAECTQTFA